jgi:hypothetical protein
MNLMECRGIDVSDLTRYAWSGLRSFQNVKFVEGEIIRIHELDNSQRQNAKKQAAQLRDCLLQAKEYFDAAGVVSLATKPVLLYYAIMSLALAEILFKQSGDSSLDRAREQHKSHGLEFHFDNAAIDRYDLRESASLLSARPSTRGGNARFGTFELWHRSAREMPLGAMIQVAFPNGVGTNRFGGVLSGLDDLFRPIPEGGLSFFDCIASLPGMLDFVRNYDLLPSIVRGQFSVVDRQDAQPNSIRFELIVHPVAPEMMVAFQAGVRVAPEFQGRLTFTAIPAGGGIYRWTSFPPDDLVTITLPHGSMWSQSEIRFWPTTPPLNEFGYLYVALFIAGSYARYFPDKWMRDIEETTPLALAVEHLIEIAERRMALLTLSELRRLYLVPK